MRKLPHIFLDCDGVLADFDAGAMPLLGLNLPPREAEMQIGEATFWQRIRTNPNFYATLPLMPDARELFDAVAHLHPTILTGCPHGGWAEPQKVEWAARYFPGTPIITCQAKDKRLHMQAGDVLVDDTLKYRHLWEEHGGIFVHHVSAAQTIRELQDLGILAVTQSQT